MVLKNGINLRNDLWIAFTKHDLCALDTLLDTTKEYILIYNNKHGDADTVTIAYTHDPRGVEEGEYWAENGDAMEGDVFFNTVWETDDDDVHYIIEKPSLPPTASNIAINRITM